MSMLNAMRRMGRRMLAAALPKLSRAAGPVVDALERRVLLTSCPSVSAGVLTVNADNVADTLVIRTVTGNLKVLDGGVEACSVAESSVTDKVIVNADAGNDSVTVESSVSTFIEFELNGGDGGDTLSGYESNDTLNGGAGNDFLTGGEGGDTLNGDGDNDSLTANDGNDFLDGGAGNDTLRGGDDNDDLLGGAGNDYLDDGAGNDGLFGEDDADTLLGTSGTDALDGGNGNDTADYFLKTANLNITLDGVGNDGQTSENDDVRGNIETLIGGSGNDTLRGSDGHNRIEGRGGNDLIYGDINETVLSSQGSDTLDGNDGDDTLYGMDGGDTLYDSPGLDVLYGGLNADTFYAYDEVPEEFEPDVCDTLDGGDGTDFIGTTYGENIVSIP